MIDFGAKSITLHMYVYHHNPSHIIDCHSDQIVKPDFYSVIILGGFKSGYRLLLKRDLGSFWI